MKAYAVLENRLYLSCGRDTTHPSAERPVYYLDLMRGWKPGGPCSRGHVSPTSLLAILHIRETLSEALEKLPTHTIVCHVDTYEPAKLMQARFLVASFLVLVQRESPLDAFQRVSRFDPWAEDGVIDPLLHNPGSEGIQWLLDSLEALSHASSVGLMEQLDDVCDELEHFSDPLEGGCHWIVPRKLMLLRSPSPMPGWDANYIDVKYERYFSPEFYVEPFNEMGVSTVVSLSASSTTGHATAAFESANIHCFSLESEEDCLVGPQQAQEFIRIMETAEGAVAVHCQTGLVQSAFFAAVYIIRRYRFSAAAAVAWMRLARPGCLTAAHEDFLRSVTSMRPAAAECPEGSSPYAEGTRPSRASRRKSSRRARVRPQSSYVYDCMPDSAEGGSGLHVDLEPVYGNQAQLVQVRHGTCQCELARSTPVEPTISCEEVGATRLVKMDLRLLDCWKLLSRVVGLALTSAGVAF